MFLIEFIFERVKSFRVTDSVGVLDFADKINYLLSAIVLLTCSLAIGLKELFYKPLACMALHKPFEMGHLDENMVENYCWIKGLYKFQAYKQLPITEKEWAQLPQINYYMWVPLVLAVQGILLYLPKLLWDQFSFSGLGVDPSELIRAARMASMLDRLRRRVEVANLADLTKQMLDEPRRDCLCFPNISKLFRQFCSCLPCCRNSGYLVCAYLFVKVIGIANLIAQLLLMRQFFGLELAPWSSGYSAAFPRISLCRMRYETRGAINSLASYCTITTNVLTEQVAKFLNIYLLIVSAVSTVSLLMWIGRLTLTRESFLIKYLLIDRCCQSSAMLDRKRLSRFNWHFLGCDGIFLIHMMAVNAGDMFTAELIGSLYRLFGGDPRGTSDRQPAVCSAEGGMGAVSPESVKAKSSSLQLDFNIQQLANNQAMYEDSC